MAYSQDAVFSCQGCEYEDTEQMVQCDSCSNWYHYSCAGPDITDDIANYPWDCKRCVIKQFALTLVNDRQTTLVSTRFESPVNTSVNQNALDSQASTLDYIEAQRLLEEEQLNRSFEIQRKFLRERFNVLKLNGDERNPSSASYVMNDQIPSFVKKDNSTSRVHFDDVVQQVPVTSTPYTATSTNEKQTNTRLSTISSSGTSVNEQHDKRFNEVCQQRQHQDSLILPTKAMSYGQRSIGSSIYTNYQDNTARKDNSTGFSQANRTSPVLEDVISVETLHANRRMLPKDLIGFGESNKENRNDFHLPTQSSDILTKAKFGDITICANNVQSQTNQSTLCQQKRIAGNQSVLEKDFQRTTHVLVAPNPALTFNQIKEDSSPEWNKLSSAAQHVEQKQHESLFVSQPNIKYQHLGFGDITNLGYPEISRETLIATNQPIQQSDDQNLIPQCNSHASITVGPGLNSNQIAARQILPRDLPKFHGSPKEWPIFISSYQNSTLVGGYSNSENLIRLQRCLHGKAMDAVRSFLLTPENVPNVIDTLRMLYGRPDLIIHSLVQQLREEQSPKMEKLSSIVSYALAVKNLCAVIECTQLNSHMNNPYLMQEILDKLPSSLKLEWSQYKRTTSHVTLISMGNWLYDIAKAASDVSNEDVVSKDGSKNNSTLEDRNDVTGGENVGVPPY